MNFFENGFEIIEDFISETWHRFILTEIENADFSVNVSGVRNINKKLKSVAQYLNSDEFKSKRDAFIAKDAQLVRAILFNKSPETNWYVTCARFSVQLV